MRESDINAQTNQPAGKIDLSFDPCRIINQRLLENPCMVVSTFLYERDISMRRVDEARAKFNAGSLIFIGMTESEIQTLLTCMGKYVNEVSTEEQESVGLVYESLRAIAREMGYCQDSND